MQNAAFLILRSNGYRPVAKTRAKLAGCAGERTLRRQAIDTGLIAKDLHGRNCVMVTRTVRRSVRVRRSPVPPRTGVGSGFLGLLSKLADASERLEKSRRRRRR